MLIKGREKASIKGLETGCCCCFCSVRFGKLWNVRKFQRRVLESHLSRVCTLFTCICFRHKRVQVQSLKGQYNDAKEAYEAKASKLRTERAPLEAEAKALEAEWATLEHQYHKSSADIDLLKIKVINIFADSSFVCWLDLFLFRTCRSYARLECAGQVPWWRLASKR